MKIEEERKKIRIEDGGKDYLVKNMDNYISDSKHFLQRGMLIEAFEAVIWAWSIMELLKELKIIEPI